MDICDREGVFKLFEDEKSDLVINFAAESHVDRSIENPVYFYKRILLAPQFYWMPVGNMVGYVSSGEHR